MSTTKEDRRQRVANMLANFAQEGGFPDAAHVALLECYIEGAATLADLYEHALEYVYSYQEREQLRLDKEKMAVDFVRMNEQFLADMEVYNAEQKQKDIERKRMSDDQRRRHESIEFARANVELSGYKVSEEEWNDSLRYADGEVGIEEYLALGYK